MATAEVENQTPRSGAGHSPRFRALWGVYLIAAALGYALGAQGLFAFGPFAVNSNSTSLARLGIAVREQSPQASPRAWAALRSDVEAVHLKLKAQERDVFDLLVAVRGLNNSGNAEWGDAEQLCRALKWPRCDRAALEELNRRSRP
jgi:hypothetical protein